MHRGTWWATVQEVTKNQADLATEHAHTNQVTIIMSLIPFNLPPSASSESVVFEEHHIEDLSLILPQRCPASTINK